jgi:hypothetical protein
MHAVPTRSRYVPTIPTSYAGRLTGFPFPPTVWSVAPNGDRTPAATGVTNIIDIAYQGLARRQDPDARRKHRLVNPTGVAIARDGTVYVTNYGTSAGKGTVLSLGKV